MMRKWRIHWVIFFILFAFCTAFITTGPAHAQCPSDVISFWTLDEFVAGSYSDSVGTNDGAEATNPPTPTTITGGKIARGQDFSAAGTTKISVPDGNDDFDWGVDQSFSVEVWMKGINGVTGAGGTADDNEVMVGRYDAGGNRIWWLGVDATTGKFDWFLWNTADVGDIVELKSVTTTAAADGNWHHVVGVVDTISDPKNVRLYVDGVEVKLETFFADGFDSTVDLNIGWLNAGGPFYYFNGTLDEIAVYNRALTATEVQEHYNGTGGPRYCLDSDSDGINDGQENAGPNNGDGNSDGIPDLSQNTVVSLLTINGGTEYVTIKTSAGTLASCAAVDNPSAGDVPTGVTFPWGFFDFTINGAASATVTFYLPAGSAPNKYFKYGPPTPGGPDSWYDFAGDGTTGVTDITSNVMTLQFVEGQRGDDIAGDGKIVDPAGPATVTSAFDSDGDGISDGEEDGGPHSGDGNEDGTPDKNQNKVASLLTINGGTEYVTIETSAGTLAGCAAVDSSTYTGGAPSDTSFPWGFFNFTINGVGAGNPATVTFYLPAGAEPDAYYKYGPSTPGAADALYEFTDETQTGVTDITDNVMTLKFVEGQRGDDIAGDGKIVDPGGPATVTSTPVTPPPAGDGGGGGGCFINTAAN